MKKIVEVVQIVEVEIDETKFDEKFMQEFRDSFYEFQTLDEHFCHLAQLVARGFMDGAPVFIEGYGPSNEMGIKWEVTDVETEVVDA